MSFDDCFKIGYISKTHGLRGEVTAVMESGVDIEEFQVVQLEQRGNLVPYRLEKISGTAAKPFLKLEGIQSLEAASSLKGCSIYALKSQRSKPKPGEFYDDELVGFKAKDKNAGPLGIVSKIQHQGANRLLAITDGAKEILVPVNAPFIKRIDRSKKLVVLELPDGYDDL